MKTEAVEIIDGVVFVAHVHLSVAIPPQMSVSSFIEYLKGKSTLMVYSATNKRYMESILYLHVLDIKFYETDVVCNYFVLVPCKKQWYNN